MSVKVSLDKLLERGAHFGHQSRRWNPKMKPYIYGEENGIHLFDLVKTKEALEEAFQVLTKVAKERKGIVFVGTKNQAKEKIAQVAKSTGSYYVNERWLGGTLTNLEQMKASLRKLEQMEQDRASGKDAHYTKKERLLLDRKRERIKRFFGGLVGLSEIPGLIVIVDVKKEAGAAKEAEKMGIKTIGLVDTNSDPDLVTYPIPMNDDAVKAIDYVLGLMGEAILESKKGKSKKKPKGDKI